MFYLGNASLRYAALIDGAGFHRLVLNRLQSSVISRSAALLNKEEDTAGKERCVISQKMQRSGPNRDLTLPPPPLSSLRAEMVLNTAAVR